MKALVIALLSLAVPFTSFANMQSNQDYFDYVGKFYHVSQQKFKSISCVIDDSTVTSALKVAQKRLDDAGFDVKVSADLSKYKMIMKPNSYPVFETPVFKVEGDKSKVVKQEYMAAEAMVNALNIMLASSLEASKPYFESLLTLSSRNEISNVEISEEHGEKVVKFKNKRQDLNVKIKDAGKSIRSFAYNKVLKTKSTMNYMSIDGSKLLLSDATVQEKMGNIASRGRMSQTYQKLGKIYFPKKTSILATSSIGGAKINLDLNYTFKDCVVK